MILCKYSWEIPGTKCKIIISSKIVRSIIKESIHSLPNEAIGTLFGSYLDNGRVVSILRVIHDKKGVTSSTNHVSSPADNEKDIISNIFSKTKEKIHYIGDWHSHPGAVPNPSMTDEETLLSLTEQIQVRTDNPIMLIIGNSLSSIDDISCFVVIDKKIIKGILL